MPELPIQVPGEPAQAEYINDVAARTVQRYADQAQLDSLNPTPETGDLAFLDTGRESRVELLLFDGTSWKPIWLNDMSAIAVIQRSGAILQRLENLSIADNAQYSRVVIRTSDVDGYNVQVGSLDGSIPTATVFKALENGAEFITASGFNFVFWRQDTVSRWRFNIQAGAGNLRLQSSNDGNTWNTVETWVPV